MAIIQNKTSNKSKFKFTEKRRLLAATATGMLFLITPIILIFVDPMFIVGKRNFRLENGSVLHEIFSKEVECSRFEVSLFNITNADRFLAGEDDKLKMEEVGPFTYIEYRVHKDLLIKDGLMTYTPQLRPVFVREESFADPEDLNITMANLPMLSAATLLSKSPFFVRSMFNMIATQLRSKPIVNKSIQEYLWGYEEPVLSFANKLAPGLIHFQRSGIMDRMYDKKSYFHLELGATDEDKFSVKTVKHYRIISSGDGEVVTESISTYNNTYEGIAYPPKLSPDAPLNILRVGICKSFPMTICGKTTSEYGPDARIYEMGELAFGNRTLCNSKGFCPSGLMDMSPCYFGLPLALSKGHFLDGDPALFDKIEGLKPDKTKHSSHIVIEPKIGLTLETKLSLQANIVLGNLNYNSEARRFSDIVLPIAHFKIGQPRLPEIAVKALRLMYITMPKVLLIVEVVECLLGILLLCYSAKLVHKNYSLRRKKEVIEVGDPKFCRKVKIPLINKL